ncbi:AraC family transcriptional regulator [Paenibacillus sp. NFR01]|uniref:AraC family transcriptional regulator n=1 Tax=Paenibacillus sp. NFR01 TaxID=1566279 RepID=UPI0008CEA729|nr:AraC family transcriptional regulator [Paenibacillus sp. NFR01]SEU20453.1 AraC-type DNA-binding protein [Paenibacillus sp. NFR01]
MLAYRFQLERPVEMAMTGKFVTKGPGWTHLSRTLREYELFVPTEGTLYLSNGTERLDVNVGEYLLMPPHTLQFGYRESECSFYWLHFHAAGQEVELGEEEHRYEEGVIVLPRMGELRSLDKMAVMLKQLQDSVRSYREKTLNDYLTTATLCELYNQMFRRQTPSKNQAKQQLYNDVIDYIKWRRREPLKVSEIGEHFGYNPKHLSALFASISGITLKQYLVQQKMETAKFLLADTNRKVTEIAEQLGYPDSHPFMKSFKKATGLTPTEYRNAYAGRLVNH